MILHGLDIACLWLIWWVSLAALAGGHEVRTVRALVLQLSLLALMVCSFVGAIATYVQPDLLPWWSRGLVYATAAIGAWLYDYRFGIARHLQMLWGAVRAALKRRQHRDNPRPLA